MPSGWSAIYAGRQTKPNNTGMERGAPRLVDILPSGTGVAIVEAHAAKNAPAGDGRREIVPSGV